MTRILTILPALLLTLAAAITTAGEIPKGEIPKEGATLTPADQTVSTARVKIKVADTGLPEQIHITAHPSELPLALRATPEKITESMLLSRGRGPRLRTPVRIEVSAEGVSRIAVPAEKVVLTQDGLEVKGTAQLDCGAARIGLETTTDRTGGLWIKATLESSTRLDSLDLVMDLAGPVDTLIPGMPLLDTVKAFDPAEFTVPAGEGIVWQNTGLDAFPGARKVPGVISHFFLGGGDFGFTWLTDPAQGWVVSEESPSLIVSRDKAGEATLRIRLINTAGTITPARTLSFALLTHPATFPLETALTEGWLQWPAPAVQVPSLTMDSVRTSLSFVAVRADRATVYESLTRYAVLTGPAGGDALSLEQPYSETYPMALTRYLSGSHTGLTARLESNGSALLTRGDNPSVDRVLLGRALLHGIGLAPEAVSHLGELARTVRSLEPTGFFSPDGRSEFLPYWRSHIVLRYGEVFSTTDTFSLNRDDPLARVYVSVYIRPLGENPAGPRQAIIILVNEGSQAVRDQLYLTSPDTLFGGPNRLTWMQVAERYDTTARSDPISDWSPKNNQGSRTAAKNQVALMDLEDNGIIHQASLQGGVEAYGPHIHLPARSFRILYGKGE